MSAALQAATRWALRDAAMRTERIYYWAPLVPLGTHYRAPGRQRLPPPIVPATS
jgi:hypothetical protein